MNVKKWIAVLVLACLAVMAVQVLQHLGQQFNAQSSLAAVMFDYNTLGEQAFRNKVAGMLKSIGIDPGPSGIRITEDRKANRVTVELVYRKTLWLLFVPIERTLTVRQEATLVEI
jgi:hypothetical protein